MAINNIIVDEQNGFRPKRSCGDHIFFLTSIIKNRLVDGRQTLFLFFDFQKAFDCENTAMIALSANRALEAIIGKFRVIQNMGWGFKQYFFNGIMFRIRFFLGAHRLTRIPFIYSEMLWQCTRYRQWLNTCMIHCCSVFK